MRLVNQIVLHCTFTQPTATPNDVMNAWRNIIGNDTPICHSIFETNGSRVDFATWEETTYGVKGYNKHIISIGYIGGVNEYGVRADTRTCEQKSAMFEYIKKIKQQYPRAYVLGHNQMPKKTTSCPNFHGSSWFISALLEELQTGQYNPCSGGGGVINQ